MGTTVNPNRNDLVKTDRASKWAIPLRSRRLHLLAAISVQEHPDWLAMNYDGEGKIGGMLDLANPATPSIKSSVAPGFTGCGKTPPCCLPECSEGSRSEYFQGDARFFVAAAPLNDSTE